ncbi:MAG: Rnase Y domain-containing protein, partial [Bacteroidales bacterium]|nr:Rnase Y domain-containing protein [Bacteroidales bacterium]
MPTTLIIAVIVAIAGVGLGILLAMTILKKSLTKKSQQLITEAEEKAEIIKKDKVLQAKEKFLQLKADFDKQCQERNSNIQKNENKLKQRELIVNQKIEELQKEKNDNAKLQSTLEAQIELTNKKQAEIDKHHKDSVAALEKISNLTAEEAKQQLVESMKEEATAEAMVMIRDIVDEAKLTANTEAKKIVVETIQRTATENAIENSVSVFHLENDEVKGRIIGREGRNIKALESLTGVEIIIDDSPDSITLSGFDPVRREIARLSLHKLVADGRIHPARIEKDVDKTT